MAKQSDFEFTPLDISAILASMFIPGWGLQASTGRFQGARFGTDSVQVAMDLIQDPSYRQIVKDILLSLMRLQAQEEHVENPLTDAVHVGQIIHEHRQRIINGVAVTYQAAEIITRNGPRWGGDVNGFTYFGSVDVTPDFVRAAILYTQLYGTGWLGETIEHELVSRNGKKLTYTIRDSILAAVRWVVYVITDSPLGLLELQRRNPNGHPNPTWRDNPYSFLHANGEFANGSEPLAAFDVQASAEDALMMSARFFKQELPQEANEWEHLAIELRTKVIRSFWVGRSNSFAQALDRHPRDGTIRQVTTITSTPAEALTTGFFEHLPSEERDYYVGRIVEVLFSDRLRTPFGPRLVDVRMQGLLPCHTYHGPTAVWALSTNRVTVGLRRYGLFWLARWYENGLLNQVNIAGTPVELTPVLADGTVHFDLAEAWPRESRVTLVTTYLADLFQAWTTTAVKRISYDRSLPPVKIRRNTEKYRLQVLYKECLGPNTLLKTHAALEQARQASGAFHIVRDREPIRQYFLNGHGFPIPFESL